jgi:AcrR family transcriptional regulator
MPANGSDAGSRDEPEIATPRAALARLRGIQTAREAEAGRKIEEAMLIACGRGGYRNVTVAEVLELYGGYRSQFYRHFASKADCYAAAYESAIKQLCAALLDAAAAEPSWRAGLRAALRELSRFASGQPDLARGLLVEVHVAGGPALGKRGEALERLTRAVDSARRESHHSPPPITAAFMVSAIEAAVCQALVRGEPRRFRAAVPELVHLVVAAYFDEEAAREELAVAGRG